MSTDSQDWEQAMSSPMLGLVTANGMPTDKVSLLALGYEMRNRTQCKGCFVALEWWLTPGGLFVPFEWDKQDRVTLHYINCPTKTPACFERMKQYDSELKGSYVQGR